MEGCSHLRTFSLLLATLGLLSILYGLMLKDGFYSAAPLGSPRDKKWLSVQIRRKSEYCFGKSEKLGTPVNMKNRNIVDYLALCHTV